MSAYRTNFKRLNNQTPFQVVYGREAVAPTKFVIPNLIITKSLQLSEEDSLKERLHELQELEEDMFLAESHQTVQKERQKSWHDRHIKRKTFMVGGNIFLYDSKFQRFPGKLRMHWLGLYHVIEIRDSRAIQLAQLDG